MKVNKDYIDHPKTKVYGLLAPLFCNDKKICCHYTSTNVLDILLSKATFRASHLFYLNDSSELLNGINQLKKIFKKAKINKPLEILNNIQYSENKRKIGLYSISFSSDSDILHQWITYAKESGVCLVLDVNIFEQMKLRTIHESDDNKKEREKLLKGEKIDDPVSVLNNVSVTHNALDIIYTMKYDDSELDAKKIYELFATLDEEGEDSVSLDTVDKKWDTSIENGGGDARLYLLLIAALLKNKDFRSEEEIRAIFLAEKEGVQKMKINYFPMSNGILRPYCEIVFCDNNEAPMIPLKELVVGPSGNQQGVFDSVVHRLKYGETHIWDYWSMTDKSLFKDNFYNYVIGAIKRYMYDASKTIDEETSCIIFDKLKESWELESDSELAICNRQDFLDFNEKLSNDKKIIFDIKADEVEQIYEKIERDNYFSREGVWIRKSEIPYIF